MANKNIFKSKSNIKDSDAVNEASGKAYALSDKATLAQLVLTGTFNNTFYATDTDQLKQVIDLANKCNVEFVAKLAVYARQHGFMKDTPAVLASVISHRSSKLLKSIFPFVIDDMKMVRNFVQVIRSGVVGRKSLGSVPKKLIQNFLSGMTDEQLFKSNIGNDPSLADIIKLTHPKPNTPERDALYGYILDRKYNEEHLLPLARSFETFKKNLNADIPNVPLQMLTSLNLTPAHWKFLASRASWNQTRLNLNTFVRQGVFEDKNLVNIVADKLQNAEEVKNAKVFPYQLFSTFMHLGDDVPASIKLSLQKSAELAISNVPKISGDVIIALDVSGSMRDAITGKRGSATSKMRCIDVASLFAAAILRNNPTASVIPFDTQLKKLDINPMDSIITNAQKFAASGANGGTDCGVVLAHLNEFNTKADAIIMISDNQSWVQSSKTSNGETSMMREWTKFKNRNHKAKLLNIDIAPYATTQVYDTTNSINLGGFSDAVFDVVSSFVKDNNIDSLLKEIECVNLVGNE